MTNKEILQSDLLDILFENRNKEYGAYTLRRNYNNRLGLGLGCALSIVFLLIIVNSFSEKKGEKLINDEIRGPVILIEPVKEKEKPIKPETRQVKQVKNSGIKIVPEKEMIQTEVPDQEQLNNALTSNKNVEGETPTVAEKSSEANSNQSTITDQSTQENIKPFFPKEISASYPGGTQAFSDFLSRNLTAPEELESGEKKTVLVRFLVDVDGSISKIEIIQSGGKNFDKEVMRVLRKMPKWNPAEQNGHKVAITFSQPVTFVGIEQ